jgi:hypothetical protein
MVLFPNIYKILTSVCLDIAGTRDMYIPPKAVEEIIFLVSSTYRGDDFRVASPERLNLFFPSRKPLLSAEDQYRDEELHTVCIHLDISVTGRN